MSDKSERVTVDYEALVQLINAINEVHDTHTNPHSLPMQNLLVWKKKVWNFMKRN